MTEPSVLFKFELTNETSACIHNADLKVIGNGLGKKIV
jgi:hypothetical protein